MKVRKRLCLSTKRLVVETHTPAISEWERTRAPLWRWPPIISWKTGAQRGSRSRPTCTATQQPSHHCSPVLWTLNTIAFVIGSHCHQYFNSKREELGYGRGWTGGGSRREEAAEESAGRSPEPFRGRGSPKLLEFPTIPVLSRTSRSGTYQNMPSSPPPPACLYSPHPTFRGK